MDFEVHSVTKVLGFGDRADPEVEFLPFTRSGRGSPTERPRLSTPFIENSGRLSARQLRGSRSSYIGSETFISLVDAHGSALVRQH